MIVVAVMKRGHATISLLRIYQTTFTMDTRTNLPLFKRDSGRDAQRCSVCQSVSLSVYLIISIASITRTQWKKTYQGKLLESFA